MDNFMDEDEDEDIFTDNDVIEIDDTEYMFGEPYAFLSEESNMPDDSSNSRSNSDSQSLPNDTIPLNFSPEHLKLLNEFSIDQYAKVNLIPFFNTNTN